MNENENIQSHSSRSASLFLAEVAELADRFDDMAHEMKRFVAEKMLRSCDTAVVLRLSKEERNLLAVAYKNSLSSRQQALRSLKCVLENKDATSDQHSQQTTEGSWAKEYEKRVTEEAQNICMEILEILAQLLENFGSASGDSEPSESSEDLIFYQKMRGDYYRHMVSFCEGDARRRTKELARWSYGQAEVLAERDLQIWHPMRLALALNYSIFIAEFDLDERAARQKARKTYYGALDIFDEIPEAGTEKTTWPFKHHSG